MSLVTAIIRREMFRRLRDKKFYVRRTSVVVLAGCLVVGGFIVSARFGTAAMGVVIFRQVTIFLMIAACFAAPWSSAPVLAQEKEDRTLGLLLLSGARPWQIVSGKLFSAMFSVVALVLSGLPMLVLCVGLGGVSALQILNGLVVLFAAVFLGCSLGLAVSSGFRSPKLAVAGAVLVSLILFVGVPLGVRLWGAVLHKSYIADIIVPAVSPFSALGTVVLGSTAGAWIPNCIFNIAVALLFLVMAVSLVPGLALDRERHLEPTVAPGRRRSVIRGNPITWKEQISSRSSRAKWLLCVLALVASVYAAHLGFVSPLVEEVSDYGDLNTLSLSLVMTTIVCAVVFAAGTLLSYAMCFSQEKQSRAFELLTIAGLSETEIVLGKLWAPIRIWFPWLAMAALSVLFLTPSGICWAVYRYSHEWMPLNALVNVVLSPALAIAAYLSVIFSMGSLAMYLSLRFHKGIAIGVTTIVSIPWILNSAAMVLPCSDYWEEGAFVTSAMVVIFNVAFTYVCLGKLFHRLRQISSGERTL